MSNNADLHNQKTVQKSSEARQPFEAKSFYKLLGRLLAERWKRECEERETQENP